MEFGGRDFDYAPFRADGILGYDATGAYNSNFDMHQYTARKGSDTPSSDTKATTAGQQFEFYDKKGINYLLLKSGCTVLISQV